MVRIVERRGGVCIIRVLYYTPAEIATTRCCSCQSSLPQVPPAGFLFVQLCAETTRIYLKLCLTCTTRPMMWTGVFFRS